jgi:hypothetical protein
MRKRSVELLKKVPEITIRIRQDSDDEDYHPHRISNTSSNLPPFHSAIPPETPIQEPTSPAFSQDEIKFEPHEFFTEETNGNMENSNAIPKSREASISQEIYTLDPLHEKFRSLTTQTRAEMYRKREMIVNGFVGTSAAAKDIQFGYLIPPLSGSHGYLYVSPIFLHDKDT